MAIERALNMAILNSGDTKIIDVDGKPHEVRTQMSGTKLDIYVDGALETSYSLSFFLVAFGDLNDYAFHIAGHPATLAMRYGKTRIALDGKYVPSGEPFKPVLPLPRWGSAFFILNIGAPFVLNGKLLDYLFSAGCGYICTHYILKNPDLKGTMQKKIILCVLATALSWVVCYLFNRGSI